MSEKQQLQRWKITIEYDGTNYAGWQMQHNAPSIQQSIEEAIFAFTNTETRLHVAGRTDAGVHALGQVAHLDLHPKYDAKAVRDATNHHLGNQPIKIIRAEAVDQTFHARFGATKRYYCYKILMDRTPPPVVNPTTVWHVWKNLDIDKMNQAAKHFIGTHDFSSFRAAECQAKSPIRTMDQLSFSVNNTYLGDGTLIELWAEAQSFLHHQIRNIVGTLKEVGEGKRAPNDIIDILNAKDRAAAGATAPASGLHFVKVDYDKEKISE